MRNSNTCLAGLLLVFGLSICYALPAAAATATDPKAQTIKAPKRFGFADVRRRAEQLAKSDFVEDKGDDLPEFFRNIGYDQYRDIRFQQGKAVWLDEGLPFVLRFFHRGFLFIPKVAINLLEAGEIKPVTFNRDMFQYGPTAYDGELPADTGFAGMQIFFPLLEDQSYSEVAVFLGASYFRAVGQNLNYGLSARGLAIDTGLVSGEEFPSFREFWVEKPDKDATALTVYALLDSPSLTGAYRFLIKPGTATVFETKLELFLRKSVQKLGIAPLTSMYYHGELSERFYDDFRPEVHDSDGLMLNFSSGEWLWRPINNRHQLRIKRYNDSNLRGFGLFQRDRDYNNYQDLEAVYHQRPSTWVEPLSGGITRKGAVELVEIPTDAERNDNIVAFWVPERPARAGDQLSFEYQLAFGGPALDKVPGARAQGTRIGGGGSDSREQHVRKFMIDFTGKNLEKLPTDTPVEALVSASSGELRGKVTQYNPFTKGWRVFFELLPGEAEEVELRCFLRSGGDVLSETWSYQWFKK